MNTCPDCPNDLVCHDQGECLRPTPETDFEESAQTQRFGGYMVKAAFARRLERERDEAREENAKLREALEKSKEFVQSWGELIDTQYPLWNECMTTIQKALTQ